MAEGFAAGEGIVVGEEAAGNWLLRDKMFRRVVIVLISSVTVLAAVVTLLQTNASARSARATRDAQRYAIQAMGRRISGQAQVNYDWYAYQSWNGLDLQALSNDSVDEAAAERYRKVRDQIAGLSPLLATPYFDPQGGNSPNLAAYESDTYWVDWTSLTEHYAVSGGLSNAWNSKANAYVTHLALLAVTLFLYGLATTLAGWTRLLFVAAGSAIVAAVLFWGAFVTFGSIPFISDQAIDAYARGVGFSHQDEREQAIAAFDRALALEPDYANALFERGNSEFDLQHYTAAVADYEGAQAAGRDDINVGWNLGWTYYLLGRFDDAVRMDRHALTLDSRQIGIHFNLGLAMLAAGQMDAAKAQYQNALEVASRQVTEAKAAQQEPPSSLWTYMDAGARDLESLVDRLSGRSLAWTEAPDAKTISNPADVQKMAQSLITQIKSWTVALEFTDQPPKVQVTAHIGNIEFAQPKYDADGNLLGKIVTDAFPHGTDRILALFDYAGMQDEETVVWKLYHDGYEDAQWRLEEKWSLGESGSAQKAFSLAYSNLYIFSAGEYRIEMYVDSQLVQQGTFTILPEEP